MVRDRERAAVICKTFFFRFVSACPKDGSIPILIRRLLASEAAADDERVSQGSYECNRLHAVGLRAKLLNIGTNDFARLSPTDSEIFYVHFSECL
jgi:hypothetical protein